MSDPKPYTLADLEDAPVDDIWGSNDTRIVVTKENVAATIEDNARLRALVKAQERGNHEETASGAGAFCPWCGADGKHTADCSAFTPDGDVR